MVIYTEQVLQFCWKVIASTVNQLNEMSSLVYHWCKESALESVSLIEF